MCINCNYFKKYYKAYCYCPYCGNRLKMIKNDTYNNVKKEESKK